MALLDKRREMFISGSIEPLPGEFSVSATKKVQFAPGNLQAVIGGGPIDTYNYTASKWKLAENQWDYIGTNTSFDIGGTVDLFGWVGEKAPQSTSTYGLCTSTGANSYGTRNNTDLLRSDWGNLFDHSGNTWRTLTKDEWDYLLNRTTLYGAYAKACLFGTTHGVIIFPDSYTHPVGVAVPLGINGTDNTSWYRNTYNATNWAKMEDAGCVFLPAAGSRYGTNNTSPNSHCFYWSSTPNTYQNSYIMRISDNYVLTELRMRFYGCSVRLVKDVK